MGDLPHSDLLALVKQQQTTISAQQATNDEQQQLAKTLVNEVRLAEAVPIGHRRERFEAPRQGTLFDAVPLGEKSSSQDEASPSDDDAPKRRGKGRTHRVFPNSPL